MATMSGQPSAPKRTAQLELNAANLAQQRQQPFEARMPRIRGKAGAKDLLPLGREGAVCSLCGMAGHDAEVCADRPAPKLTIDVSDLDTTQDPLEVSMSDLPDSPSALFPKPTAAELLARRKQLEAEEAEAKAKEEAKKKALDPGPRMDGGGAEGGEPPPTEPRVIPPKPPPPKKWGVPPPPKDKLPIRKEHTAAPPPPGPPRPFGTPDMRLDRMDLTKDLAGFEQERARIREKAVHDLTEDVVDTVLSRDAAVNLTRESIENVIEKAAEEQAAELKRQQAEALAKMGVGGDGAGPDAGSGQALVQEARAKKPLPGVQTPHSILPGYPPTEPLKPKPRARQPNVIDDEADAVRDMVDEAIIGAIDANAADDNAVHDLMATVLTNVIEGPPPPEDEFPEEGGRAALEAALRDANEQTSTLRVRLEEANRESARERSEHFARVESLVMELHEAREEIASRTDAATEAELREQEALAAINALKAQYDAERQSAREDAEAVKVAARMASEAVAEEAKRAKDKLEIISRNAERDAARAKEQIENLRRQLDVAEIKAKKAADISSEALADAKGDLMHAREEVKEWARKARAADGRAAAAEEKANKALARAEAAEASEQRLLTLQRRTKEAAGRREELEVAAATAAATAVAAGASVSAPKSKASGVATRQSVLGKSRQTAKDEGVDPALAKARASAVREAAQDLEREKAAAAKAASDAKRLQRKAIEAEEASAAARAISAPPYLKGLFIASRAFVCASPEAAAEAEALAKELGSLGYPSSVRPDGVDAAPARAKSAAAVVVHASADGDAGCQTEVAAAVAAGRRVVALCEGSPPSWLGPGTVAVGPAGGAKAVVKQLGPPATLLERIPANSIAAIAGAGAGPDLMGLAGLTSLRLPDASPAIVDALIDILKERTCTIRSLLLPGCGPDVAVRIASAAFACASCQSLSFGGASLPLGEIRKQGESLEALDLTADAGADGIGLRDAEIAALKAILGEGDAKYGANVTKLVLPPLLSASQTRKVVEAIGCRALPSINGVPASMSVKEGASPYSLDIAGTPCGVPGLVTLSGAVTKLAKGDVATLRFLALGETALGPKGGIALAEILRDGSCAGLERLSLPGAGLGAEGVEAVCAALPPKLQALDLGSNGCGDQGAKAVGEALKRCLNMKRIGLAANELSEIGARALAPFIRDHASLEELHVTGNRVGDRGCSALAMAVRSTNAPIVKLALNENFNITAGACKSLAQCIASSRTLQELDLSKVMIGAEGAKALAAGLSESPALRVLELGSCKLRADGAKFIGEALVRNLSLERLGLSRNSLGDKGVFELVAAGLQGSRSLRDLDLRHNSIGPEGAKRLGAMLERKNFVLKNLELAGNKLDASTESKLVARAASLRTRPSALGVPRKALTVSKIVEGDENQEGMNIEVPT